jgi:hypothetical protein
MPEIKLGNYPIFDLSRGLVPTTPGYQMWYEEDKSLLHVDNKTFKLIDSSLIHTPVIIPANPGNGIARDLVNLVTGKTTGKNGNITAAATQQTFSAISDTIITGHATNLFPGDYIVIYRLNFSSGSEINRDPADAIYYGNSGLKGMISNAATTVDGTPTTFSATPNGWDDANATSFVRAVVVGVNSYYYKNGNTSQHVIFQIQNAPFQAKFNLTSSNAGGYSNSAINTYLMGDFKNALIEAGANLYELKRLVSNSPTSTGISTPMSVFLPTATEIGAANTYVVDKTDNVVFPYYKQPPASGIAALVNRKKYVFNNEGYWWTSTPVSNTADKFWEVMPDGSLQAQYADWARGISPCFVIKGPEIQYIGEEIQVTISYYDGSNKTMLISSETVTPNTTITLSNYGASWFKMDTNAFIGVGGGTYILTENISVYNSSSGGSG